MCGSWASNPWFYNVELLLVLVLGKIVATRQHHFDNFKQD